MKASELIIELQKAIDEHGDLVVEYENSFPSVDTIEHLSIENSQTERNKKAIHII